MNELIAHIPGVREVRVIEIDGPQVILEGDLRCRQIETAAGFLTLRPGDRVLAWIPPSAANGFVLGRVAQAPDPDPDQTQPTAPLPEELVLGARRRVVLRCGDGEIVIRADGRLLIRGTDVVSKATRANRIKGGQVVIN